MKVTLFKLIELDPFFLLKKGGDFIFSAEKRDKTSAKFRRADS